MGTTYCVSHTCQREEKKSHFIFCMHVIPPYFTLFAHSTALIKIILSYLMNTEKSTHKFPSSKKHIFFSLFFLSQRVVVSLQNFGSVFVIELITRECRMYTYIQRKHRKSRMLACQATQWLQEISNMLAFTITAIIFNPPICLRVARLDIAEMPFVQLLLWHFGEHQS